MDHTSLRRVAIVLDSLDSQTAGRLLNKMPQQRALLVRDAMSQLADVDPLERKTAIADFMQKSHTAPDPLEEVPPVVAKKADDSKDAFFNSLPIETLIELIANEHPQTIAIILASMNPSSAADLVKRLPPTLRRDSLSRLARLGEVPSDALDEIRSHLQLRMVEQNQQAGARGNQALAAILNHVEASERGELLLELSKSDPVLAMKIPFSLDAGSQPLPLQTAAKPSVNQKVEKSEKPAAAPASPRVQFQQIESLPIDALRRVLANADAESAVLSLCGMKTTTVQKLLASLPKNQRREVNGRLKSVENCRIREIDQAQSRVFQTAIAMMQNGQLPELNAARRTSQINLAA